MKTKTKKYIIKDMYRDTKTEYFVSDSTTGLEDIWWTMWPKDKEKTEEDYKPKVFENMKEAKRYLKEVKRISKADWKDNWYIHKSFGFNKPDWDIYEF